MFAVDARVSDVAGRLRVERRLTDATDEAPGVPVGVDRRQVVAFTYCPPRGPPVRLAEMPVVSTPNQRFDPGLRLETGGPIYKISYDNLTIILRQCRSYDRLTTDI